MCVKFHRRLHRHKRQQLEQVVRHHVAERACCVIETSAMADDPDSLIDRDLHVIDVIAVPDRLEHAVGKAQHQNVLNGFLAEIMIDPVDLVLIDDSEQFAVQRPGGSKVRPERLFDHQPPPCASRLLQHAGAAELFGDRGEGGGRDGEIK